MLSTLFVVVDFPIVGVKKVEMGSFDSCDSSNINIDYLRFINISKQ